MAAGQFQLSEQRKKKRKTYYRALDHWLTQVVLEFGLSGARRAGKDCLENRCLQLVADIHKYMLLNNRSYMIPFCLQQQYPKFIAINFIPEGLKIFELING
jgi:hypothetical protein